MTACTLLYFEAMLLPLWLIWMSIIRFTHGGLVISNVGTTDANGDLKLDQGYMPISGRFLFWWLMVQYAILSCSCLYMCVSPIKDSMAVNQEFLDKYEKVEQLGEGAQGSIWKVKLKEVGKDNEFFAAKELHTGGIMSPLAGPELKSLQKLDHPNCLKLVDSFGISETCEVTSSLPVIVTNYFEGKIIKDYIADRIKGKTHFKADMLKLMLNCAEAIEYLHNDHYIMHRDLNYANWLVSKDNEPCLIDFGTSIILVKNGYTQHGIYTPPMCSPEQMNSQPYSFSSDIWMLAQILFFISSGRFPWLEDLDSPVGSLMANSAYSKKKPFEKTPDEYGPKFAELIAKMLSWDEKDRPDISQVVQDL